MSSFTAGDPETKTSNGPTNFATILSWRDSPIVKLGEGSFGSVYAGTDDQQRAVAIKLLGEEQRKNAHLYDRMFNTEVHVLSRFYHPNIIQLYNYGKTNDQKALVYERVTSDLAQEMQTNGNAFAAVERLNIVIDVARGLTFMHGQESIDDLPMATLTVPPPMAATGKLTLPLVTNDAIPVAGTIRINGMAEKPCWHRDIKSANIGITGDRCGKLLDCGIAKSKIDVARTMMTVTGASQLGTPGYIAPEVVQSGKYGTRSEIYSFGVVLLELLTTKKATDGLGLVSFVQDAIEDDEVWIDHSCGWPLLNEAPVMERFVALAVSCVKRRTKDRPATMRDVMLQLIQVRNDLAVSSCPSASSFAAPLVVDVANDVSNLSKEELIQRLKDLEALSKTWQRETQAQTQVTQVRAQKNCCICQEDLNQHCGVGCASSLSSHFTCDDCLEGHVLFQLPQDIERPDFDAMKRQGRSDGSVYCPCRAAGACTALAFGDSELCQHLQSTTFQRYLTVKMKVGEHRVFERQNAKWTLAFQRIQQEMKEKGVQMDRKLLADQLRRQFPNAHQCGKCGHGPIDHMACSGESSSLLSCCFVVY